MLLHGARLRTLLLTVTVLAVAPCSAALGVTATITGDSGEAVPITGAGPTLRNIAPDFRLSFAADEPRYSFTVVGPGGQEAAAELKCNTTEYPRDEEVWYVGNGAYTIVAKIYKNADDTGCTDGTEVRFPFTINATTTVIPPPGTLMTGATATSSLTHHLFKVQAVPGTANYDLQYAVDPKFNPDGSIAGEHAAGKPAKEDGEDTLTFGYPGHYAFVARANSARGIVGYSTPWSAPVYVTIVAPFGVETVLSNAHIRTVKITGNVTQPAATGTMTVSLAKRAKGKVFKKVATVKLGTSARWVAKFKVAKPGAYKVKYSYKGNGIVLAGTDTEVVRLKR